MTTHDLDALTRLPLFRGVDLWRIRPLLERCQARTLATGEVLISPREGNTHAFVVLDGRLSVHLEGADRPPIAVLERGETVGEMSFFGGRVPSAWVVATEPCRVLAIDQDGFWNLINASHEVALNLLYILAGRVRSGNTVIGEREERANVDALTGLRNRRWLDEAFKRESQRAQAGGLPLCVAMVDIDRFKRFNDEHGHQAGDAVLRAVGAALKHNARPTDLVARYGGEEFAVLLPATPLADAVAACDRLRLAIGATEVRTMDGASLPRVTASFGVAELAAGEALDALVARADQALYRAKEGGRNRVCC